MPLTGCTEPGCTTAAEFICAYCGDQRCAQHLSRYARCLSAVDAHGIGTHRCLSPVRPTLGELERRVDRAYAWFATWGDAALVLHREQGVDGPRYQSARHHGERAKLRLLDAIGRWELAKAGKIPTAP